MNLYCLHCPAHTEPLQSLKIKSHWVRSQLLRLQFSKARPSFTCVSRNWHHSSFSNLGFCWSFSSFFMVLLLSVLVTVATAFASGKIAPATTCCTCCTGSGSSLILTGSGLANSSTWDFRRSAQHILCFTFKEEILFFTWRELCWFFSRPYLKGSALSAYSCWSSYR